MGTLKTRVRSDYILAGAVSLAVERCPVHFAEVPVECRPEVMPGLPALFGVEPSLGPQVLDLAAHGVVEAMELRLRRPHADANH